jgi:phytoene synthase
LRPFIEKYRLPFRLFDELLAGVEMDLVTVRYPDPASLEKYCYHVASVVGLLSIEIFEYTDPKCRLYADALGKALQLTNILRDVGNDAQRGRIYIPLSDLKAFGVTEEEVLQGRGSDRFQALAREIDRRARGFFAQARQLLPERDRESMMTAARTLQPVVSRCKTSVVLRCNTTLQHNVALRCNTT